MDLKKLIVDYLEQARLMQVATAVDNQPWACTVYFAYDDALHLYWLSKPTGRHSQELRLNNKVGGTIVLPHTPGDKVRGLQFQGVAEEIANKKLVKKLIMGYATRYHMPNNRITEIINNTDGHLLYRIKPTLYILFDVLNFPTDPRQEYTL